MAKTDKTTSTTRKKTTAAKTTTTKATTAAKRPKSTTSTRKASSATSSGARSLVIVESPAKAKTLQKYLGKSYKIEASVGHVKDLPPTKLGVDIEKDFEPQYVVLKGKEKVIDRIKKCADVVDSVYLAPDPDREGEAIAWHIASELKEHGFDKPIMRAKFNEITKRAVEEALQQPDELDHHLFDAQQARRVLDRLVGYKISPILWTKVTRGLSAGRVQSVALRLVVEREREIQAFIPQEYWSIETQVQAALPPPFEMRLTSVEGKKPELTNCGEVRALLKDLGFDELTECDAPDPEVQAAIAKGQTPALRHLVRGGKAAPWTVSSVEKKDVRRRPAPPFITSTLQQEAGRKLGFGAQRTMSIAQRLYEGVEFGEDGMTALITYMRTDSTRISDGAREAVREYIGEAYGPSYVPKDPNFFRTKKGAQDAHEAIRPVDMQVTPERAARYLDRDQLRLYTLIWNRFVACQMADAIFEQTKIESAPRAGYVFTATGLVPKFNGYLAVYEEGRDDGEKGESTDVLPAVTVGEQLEVLGIQGSQHFTQPPPRFSEASLVKELEKRGIGRPSTYASIVGVIQDKEYVSKDDNQKFRPTELGLIVTDLLVENFPEIMDVSFTAQMEEKLDEVEEGTQNWKALLHDFYDGGFKERLESAAKNMRSVKREEIPTEIVCDKCGEANMVIKWGRLGRFLACPRYPECKNTKEYTVTEDSQQIQPVMPQETDVECENCGRKLVVKSGRHGRFLACPGYPECRTVKPFRTGVKCPVCGTGDIVERSSRKGKLFFSCSNYPACTYALWNRPVAEPCPECGHPFMLERESARARTLTCPNDKCKHKITQNRSQAA